ncbi:MAG: hypothetical protein AAGU76_14750 [Sedimentibacter sp.]|uniref:hypothetical protein n=1 Tax=Sedimentibacter sp. TaxID=1960295 RepID=UPI00315913B1
MKNQKDEKKRALNIIWNSSGDYELKTEEGAYNQDGTADIYINFIIGAVHRHYDYKKLQFFFNSLGKDRDHEFYEGIAWVGLENCAYLKSRKERPAIENLRREYAKNLLEKEYATEKNILQELKEARCRKILGQEIQLEGRLLEILDRLEMDENLSTEEVIQNLDDIIKNYFRFNPGTYHARLKQSFADSGNKYSVSETYTLRNPPDENREQPDKREADVEIESAETARDLSLLEFDEIKRKIIFDNSKQDKVTDTDRQYIQKYFGASILSEHKTKSLESILCVNSHKNTYLHFTKGEFDINAGTDADGLYYKKAAWEGRKANIEYYKENLARNHESISKLTNKIRNTLAANFELSSSRSKTGMLAPENIWRSIYVNDERIFTKKSRNDLGDISVDILLDASASQYERKEIIASQAFIIAESFTRCHIPVRIYSFSSLRNYTVINMYRDYGETEENSSVFNYNTSGCNRDGLAVRTALYMMDRAQSEHKILIVLSDCKPNDIQCIPATGMVPAHSEYSGAAGVNDTAVEVKKGINRGISILCVFTGLDEDVPSAKKIYGHNFARISSTDRFADIVGVMMHNQLKNL